MNTIEPPWPLNELARIDKLHGYAVLDTPPDPVFDRLTQLASRFFAVPTVLVSLVDENRQWFKSRYGLEIPCTARRLSFCAYAILHDQVMVVPDATLDERFADNDLVVGPPYIRFYAGAPLRTPEGLLLGTFCIIGYQPRADFAAQARRDLTEFARIVMHELEMRAAQRLAETARRAEEAARAAAERAEARLRESEEWLRLAQTAGGILTWGWDIATGEVVWSGPLHHVLGLCPHQGAVSLDTVMQAAHPDDRAWLQEKLQAVIQGEQLGDVEFRVVRPDGTIRWLACRGEAIRDATGAPVRVIGVNYDVTERREATEALARLNADLEQRVQRAADQLVQLQKMESLGRLTGGIAHDFNNLLMAVLSSLELLEKRLPADDPWTARLIDNARQGAERGAALTRRLLAFARKQDLKPEPVAVPDLVVGMTDLLQRSLGPQVRIETRFALGLPKALADANQLELAILNLAVNAHDAMPEGGLLTIAADEARLGPDGPLPPGAYVRLRLTDTGTGMDQATLERAVEPFFTTKGVGKGTGLGLPMVHGLAAQSGGRFALASAPGQGTTAEILLPVAAATAQAFGGLPAPAEGKPASGSQGLSVFLVDDDSLLLMGTAAVLEDLGHTAIEAKSGQEALAVLRSGRAVDVVVTDQAMPGMTGLQLAAAIRLEWPGLPIVLATGYGDLPERVDLVTEVLSKPFRQQELAAALARVVDRSRKVGPLRP